MIAEMSSDGKKKKKRKLQASDELESLSVNAMRTVQPLLSCLEYALRADSQDGGRWVRADDGQRYRSLLTPIGKLLRAKIPDNFPVDGSLEISPYEYLILGSSDDDAGAGCVVDTLTALAGAAGNEQLWKPLNYAILDACGHVGGRTEVRKAGLECLLSVIRGLGEEYMVLLPECLPVLAELLEDNDEEVAGLAQDCISLGEELLGESLEESLR